MDYSNICSFRYRDDLNKLDGLGERGNSFVARHGGEAIQKGIEVILEKIIPKGEGDIHLESFLATYYSIHHFIELADNPMAVIFPSKGEVQNYILANGRFFSNIHRNPDPVIINDIEDGIHIHPTRTDGELWFPGQKFLSNRINGFVLFKKSPFENLEDYPGFKEFVDYVPRK